MPNRLADENSPYLLQHKDNPVDWHPWDQEALTCARVENKPIFLSIGYAACHWCHVMEHESFEDPETAELMNEHFINIKVDREERPDLDSIYMNAVVAMTGQGGWPMSVFLTPELAPFFGGTYFPPVRRYGMPSFKDVLLSISASWQEKHSQVLESGNRITEHLQQNSLPLDRGEELSAATLDHAALALAQSYNWQSGGWGNAPKFPQPMAIRFLLRRAAQGDKMALDIATDTLQAMARGGMYDVVGGGFARYSVDDEWLIPHFEKMLYDNALLARVYLHAHLVTGEPFYRRICEETLEFVSREMTHPQGGFFSSLDADSEGEEGKYYLWSFDELKRVLDAGEFDLVTQAYAITPEGNFEGQIVLQRVSADNELVDSLQLKPADLTARLDSIHRKLLQVRQDRIRPGTDDKVLVAWNAWMLVAFAEAARYFNSPRFLEIAQKNAAFLLGQLYKDGRLQRSWRDGQAKHNAYLEDYAGLILGLLSLYQSDHDNKWYTAATQLAATMLDNFADPEGGFFDTSHDHETLLTRPKDLQDNATPSGNSLAAEALLQIGAFTGEGMYYDKAVEVMSGIQQVVSQHPIAFPNWLCAMVFALGDVKEIAILGNPDAAETQKLLAKVWGELRPNTVVALSPFPPLDGSPPLLAGREMIAGQPTAYLCRRFVCQAPTTDPDELENQLKR